MNFYKAIKMVKFQVMSLQRSHPEDMDRIVVEAIIQHECARAVFEALIDGVPLTKIKSPETYHITLGFIHSIHSAETAELKNFLESFIDNHINPVNLQQTICRAGQFQDNDAVVLFFENPIGLRLVSKVIRKHLLNFNVVDSYDFSRHSQPQNYRPHLTVGDGTRQSIIAINDRIRTLNTPLTIISNEVQARIIPR